MAGEPVQSPETLLVAVATGNREAFGTLYANVAPGLFSICLRMLRSREQAEDCLQDAFFRIWQKSHLFDPNKGAAFAWMSTVVRRCALDRIARSGRTKGDQTLDEVDEKFLALDEGTNKEAAMSLRHVLQQLDERARRTILLAYHFGLTYEEIAMRENVPVGTIKSRVSRGLAQLKELMG